MPYLDENADSLLATVTNIDAKTAASTSLIIVPTGRTMIVTKTFIRVTSYDGTGKTTNASASFGANATSYNDFLSATAFAFTANGQLYKNEATNPYVEYAAGSDFRINITVASDATTETWTVYVFGYFV